MSQPEGSSPQEVNNAPDLLEELFRRGYSREQIYEILVQNGIAPSVIHAEFFVAISLGEIDGYVEILSESEVAAIVQAELLEGEEDDIDE